jgi:hypothetical protein
MNILDFKPKRDIWNKCNLCGRFISIEDFSKGAATREFSQGWDWANEDVTEIYENTCSECKKDE